MDWNWHIINFTCVMKTPESPSTNSVPTPPAMLNPNPFRVPRTRGTSTMTGPGGGFGSGLLERSLVEALTLATVGALAWPVWCLCRRREPCKFSCGTAALSVVAVLSELLGNLEKTAISIFPKWSY